MKHAFMIMAHNNFPQLTRLVKKLDHEDNKFFIHIDAKAAFTDSDKEMIKSACTRSELFFTNRYSVTWGAYDQVNAELRVLEEALKSNCDYYHFISGVDFPIKSMDYIHNFFDEHAGTEFIHFCSDEFVKKQYYRISCYHFLREKFGRNEKSIYYNLERMSLYAQRLFKIDRTKKYKGIEIKMGGFWYSITREFASYLIANEPLIQKIYKNTVNGDESYIQTLAYNSEFKDNIYYFKENVPENESFLRSVDWTRTGSAMGAPYDYTVDDYERLVNSKNLFARKISDQTEKGNALIEKLELL